MKNRPRRHLPRNAAQHIIYTGNRVWLLHYTVKNVFDTNAANLPVFIYPPIFDLLLKPVTAAITREVVSATRPWNFQ